MTGKNTRSSSTSNTETRKDPKKFPCVSCDKQVGGDGISCDVCSTWSHFHCAEIDKETVNKYVINKKLRWYCKHCAPLASSVLERLKTVEKTTNETFRELSTKINTSYTNNLVAMEKKISEEISALRTELNASFQALVSEEMKKSAETIVNNKVENTVKTKVDEQLSNLVTTEVDSKLTTKVEEKITEVKTTIGDEVKSYAESLQIPANPAAPNIPQEVVSTHLNEALEERERIKQKRCNLIFSNIEESTIEDDKQKVLEIVRDKLQLRDEFEIKSIARLGKKDDEKSRLLKVEFATLQQKKNILRNATKMRNLDKEDTYAKVYIRPDLTQKQIEESKNLTRLLLEKREENQNEKWMIRRGRVIRVPKTNA